jgi:anti-sigma28 factor (negative regulator of flagellin synthesis)
MKQQTPEEQTSADLAALSKRAAGEIAPSGTTDDPADAARSAKVADLKARYQAGTLSVDAAALAAKLVEAHVQERTPDARATSPGRSPGT